MKYYKTDNRADYCEMFEAVREFSKEKLPRGTSVVLVDDKIRPAKVGEIPFGVISSFPIMIGNSGGADAGSCWGGKYLTDEFGNFITEEVEVWTAIDTESGDKTKRKFGKVSDGNIPEGASTRKKVVKKVNPDYDESIEYIPRTERAEWNMVGLLGKLKILKGQPVAPNWIKMSDVSDSVEEWLVR